jgi:hypothetical protein
LVRAAHGEGAKLDLKRAGPIAWDRVGAEYCRAVADIEPDRPRLVDKTLQNFLYIGPILAALPGAKIVHVRRNAMDACYAVHKTLFRQAFEYSYDLADLGRYYLGYKAMMEHWAEVLPGRFLTVDYEELVGSQEEVSRRLVAFCGLEWEDACLSFEKNTSSFLTASAAQVREPIYTSSVKLWRHYESELAPLRRVLEEGGCDIA